MRAITALLVVSATVILTGCAAGSGAAAGGSPTSHAPTPAQTAGVAAGAGAAAASVDLGDLDDLDFDDDDLDLDDLDLDDLDLGDLDLDADDLADLAPDDLADYLGALKSNARDPGTTPHPTCILVSAGTVAVIESGLLEATIDTASAHLTGDGAYFFIAAELDDSTTALFGVTDNPARDDFDGNVVAVDAVAESVSTWQRSEDAGYGIDSADAGAGQVLDCLD